MPAAKRRKNAAHGASRGWAPRTLTSPDGAKETDLIPDVLLVILHVILLQERHILLLKRMVLMMFLLPGDVFGDRRNIRFANAEHSISGLPRKFPRPLLAHPFRRICFNHARDFRRRMYRPNAQQHMNMIVGPIDDQSHPIHFADDPPEISKQITPKLRVNERPSPQRGENKMKQDVSRCVRHASSAPPGLLPSSRAYPRLAPWAAPSRRFAASPLHSQSFSPTSVCGVPIVSVMSLEEND